MRVKITNNDILELFKIKPVYSLGELLKHFSCTYPCLWKYMHALNYHTSYTHNSKFYTLRDILSFDQNGICFIDDPAEGKIGFSKYGTLKELLVSLVYSSEYGISEKEISDIMNVRVSNQLNTLTTEGKINKIRLDGRYQYYSSQEKLEESLSSDREDKKNIPPADEHKIKLNKALESRDNWRERSNNYRKLNKLLSLKIRDLTNSRKKWKHEAKGNKHQNIILQSELLNLKKTPSQK